MANTNQIPTSFLFKGRPGDPRLGEWVIPSDKHLFERLPSIPKPSFTLIGAPDDTGITLNRGRPGAAGGPDAVRQAFYKFAWPIQENFEKTHWYDLGNIKVHNSIKDTHQEAFDAVSICAQRGAVVIAIGGGHDFAAPHILGTFNGISKNSTKPQKIKSKTLSSTFGVINIDPHLDVREFENNLPHSGTPFREIIDSKVVKGPNLIQFGARNGRNARAHFEFCKQNKIPVLEFNQIRQAGDAIKLFKKQLTTLSQKTTAIALTIDMDSCADIEGVSAAPVIGFSPWELCSFAFAAGANANVVMLELAEIAPSLDSSGRAARIGAEVLFHFLMGKLSSK